MSQLERQERIQRIQSLAAFRETFAELRQADPAAGANIENALRAQLAETAALIGEAGDNLDRLRYALYRQKVELNAGIAPFLRYTESMARRETELWKFATLSTEQFFDMVFDALDDYFRTKQKLMEGEIGQDATWYSGLRDTAKKSGLLVNLLAQKAAEKANASPNDWWKDGRVIDDRSIVEKVLDHHLGRDSVVADVSKILETASLRYQDAWKRQVQAQTPGAADTRAFAVQGATSSELRVAFGLGHAEQALGVGLAGAVAGSVGLAAGWHTITYAMLHVFPPAALFALLATGAVGWLTKNEAAGKRKAAVADAVRRYHRHFLTLVDTENLAELGGTTLRKAMLNQAGETVRQVMADWNRAVSGNLTTSHYQQLTATASAHLDAIEEALADLQREPEGQTSDPTPRG